jgi:hypothetical protein
MVEEVLPVVPYRQLVFTIPIALRRDFLLDRSLYGDLCRLAYASTRDYLHDRAGSLPAGRTALPAMVVSPQSHGDLLTLNPHAHSICSLGLFRPDGVYLPMEDVEFEGLEELFRKRFFSLMLRRGKVRPETVERMRSWEHSGFNVDSTRKLDADDRAGLQGLLSYMERAPVSLRRLNYRQSDGMVHYQASSRVPSRENPGLELPKSTAFHGKTTVPLPPGRPWTTCQAARGRISNATSLQWPTTH